MKPVRSYKTPAELRIEFEAEAAGVSVSDFIRKPERRFLKETWCALQFAEGYEKHVAQCEVWVNPEEYSDTDFVLKVDGHELPFQTVIADVPGRAMGDEYKPGADGKLPIRPYEPDRGRIEGPTWIANAVSEKVKKCYSCSAALNLLVYANFSANELDYGRVCAEVMPHAVRFASVWVITNHQICSVTGTTQLGEIRQLALIHEPQEILLAM